MRSLAEDQAAKASAAELLHWLNGFRTSCVVATAVSLGLLDGMAAGFVGLAELSRRLEAHEPSLRRLVRALDTLGIVESRGDAVGLTAKGRLLIDPRAGLRDWALLTGEEYMAAWVRLRQSVLTGEPVFRDVFGMDVWEHRSAHPALDESFNRVMASQQARAKGAILAAYDFSGCRLVVDVGCGSGALMTDILRQHPGTRGVVFDQPHVVERARTALSAAGVLDRCRVVAGSFLDFVPPDGDLYILRHVLHDWSDADCATILRHCRGAMTTSGTLLVVDNVVPEGTHPTEALTMLDLHMMVMLGGRERTLSEYRSLLRAAGFEVRRCASCRPYAEMIVAAPDGPGDAGEGPRRG